MMNLAEVSLEPEILLTKPARYVECAWKQGGGSPPGGAPTNRIEASILLLRGEARTFVQPIVHELQLANQLDSGSNSDKNRIAVFGLLSLLANGEKDGCEICNLQILNGCGGRI